MSVLIETSLGDMTIDLYTDEAPKGNGSGWLCVRVCSVLGGRKREAIVQVGFVAVGDSFLHRRLASLRATHSGPALFFAFVWTYIHTHTHTHGQLARTFSSCANSRCTTTASSTTSSEASSHRPATCTHTHTHSLPLSHSHTHSPTHSYSITYTEIPYRLLTPSIRTHTHARSERELSQAVQAQDVLLLPLPKRPARLHWARTPHAHSLTPSLVLTHALTR